VDGEAYMCGNGERG
jgi:alpha-tubulin suppressor-like RCC1 family protein